MSLDKILRLASPAAETVDGDLAVELEMAAQLAVRELALMLAKDDSDDGPGDDGDDDSSDGGGGHSDHGTYKALIKKGVKPAMAAQMCAKADSKAEMTALAESACVLLSRDDQMGSPSALGRLVELAAPGESAADRRSLAARGWALEDGTYPIPGKQHLHAAAVLSLSGQGRWLVARSLIRKRARDLGVDVTTLPGFSSESGKAADAMVALAAKGKPMGDGGVPMHHPPFTGTHTHSHHLTASHDHPHQHFGDNSHHGGPQHRPGSKPGEGSGFGY